MSIENDKLLQQLEESLRSLDSILRQFPKEHQNEEILTAIDDTFKDIEEAKKETITTEAIVLDAEKPVSDVEELASLLTKVDKEEDLKDLL